MKLLKAAVLGASLFFVGASASQASATLDAVKKKGYVQCGFHVGLPGFSLANSKGEWNGIDVDLCKALATMVFNDPAKYKATPLTTQQRFTALQSGEVDVLTRNTTATLARDTTLGLMSPGINFYDSQGIMVKKRPGVKSAKELGGAAICVQPGTTTTESGRLVPCQWSGIQTRGDQQPRRSHALLRGGGSL